jgi:hypothetical protein
VFKGKKSKRSNKIVEFKVFHTFLLVDGSGSVEIMTDPEPGGSKTYGSGSTTLICEI